MLVQSLSAWYDTPLGRYALARERTIVDAMVDDIFGFHAVQLGVPGIDLLAVNRIPHKHTVDPIEAASVKAHFHELPFAQASVDLVVMAHVLEFTDVPHEILREVDRVLIPEGRVVIVGFNPWSLWGLRRAIASAKEGLPWSGEFVSLVRMKDWLSLLGYDLSAGKLACYAPPFENDRWRERFGFMEPAGDRWWGVAGGVYVLEAIKRVIGMRVITPAWQREEAKERRFAAAARRVDVATRVRSAHLTVVK